MAPPDLSTPESRDAYRSELIRFARGWRWIGLAIVAAGAVCLVAARRLDRPLLHSPLGLAALGAELVGWMILAGVIVARTRYHKRRMAS